MHRDAGKRRSPLCDRPCSVLPYDAVGGRCRHCGKELVGQQRSWCGPVCERTYQDNHLWQFARKAALKRDGYGCVRCGTMMIPAPEVNHRIPRNGQGYGKGCHHHLDNLETLCHAHHVKVTRAQRVSRARMRSRRREQLRSVV